MSTTECAVDVKLAPASNGARTIGARLLEVTADMVRALRNRAAANRLCDLDDRQLEDIGLTRHDVRTALESSGVLDDPSLSLTRAARERARTRFARPPRR